MSIYPLLSPPNLTAHASNRVCNALALLQVGVYIFFLQLLLLFGRERRVGQVSLELKIALGLLFCLPIQCVASHKDTRTLFLNAHVPLFLYPFLNTTSKTRPFEYLRLTSLGVIGALVKVRTETVFVRVCMAAM